MQGYKGKQEMQQERDQKSSSIELCREDDELNWNCDGEKRATYKALCDESVSVVGVLEWLMWAFE